MSVAENGAVRFARALLLGASCACGSGGAVGVVDAASDAAASDAAADASPETSIDAGSCAPGTSWSALVIDGTSPTWTPSGTSAAVTDVIGLDYQNFLNQTLANPHVQPGDNGDWLIMAYGDESLGDTSVGDALYVVTKRADGSYSIPTKPALAFPPAPSNSDWTHVGGLGAGSGFAKAPRSTSGGYRYFAIVPVGVFTPASGWLSWAVSADGQSWHFVNAARDGLIDDPHQSLPLIRRGDLDNRYWHVAMMFDHDANADFFYVAQGYAGACGIKATWWRIRFDASDSWGLGSIELLQNGTFVASNGVIPDDGDAWECQAQDPSGAADPMDLIELLRCDGSFDSVLFTYQPEAQFGSTPTPISYVRGDRPLRANGNFVWSAPTLLSTAALQNAPNPGPYSACGAGGGYYLGMMAAGWDLLGRPNLRGYVSTWPEGTTTPPQGHMLTGSCANQPQGLLEIGATVN